MQISKPWALWAGLALLLILGFIVDIFLFHWLFGNAAVSAGLRGQWAGVVAVLLALCIAGIVTNGNPLNALQGEDGTWSTSICQTAVWFLVGTFALVAYIFAQTALGIDLQLTPGPNLLAAMGISVTTLISAKAITTAQADTQSVAKATNSQGGLFVADNGTPELTKIQLLTWTLIAALVFGATIVSTLAQSDDALKKLQKPWTLDIDSLFMAFMGVGSVAYLGKKITASQLPVISKVEAKGGDVRMAKDGDTVRISGSLFGDPTPGNQVLINGQGPVDASLWTDNAIEFTVPVVRPDNSQWGPMDQRETVQISVVVNGRQSNALPLVIIGNSPTISSAQPQSVNRGREVHITGNGLFALDANGNLVGSASVVVFDSTPLDPAAIGAPANAKALDFTVPDQDPRNGADWPVGNTPVDVTIRVKYPGAELQSNSWPLKIIVQRT